MKMNAWIKRKRNQAGIGLIEILITVVLLSIGFLAAARMQVEGMRFSQSAYHQSQAYFLANDMINRMRANSKGVGTGSYDGIRTSANAEDPDCSNNFCSPDEVAEQDVYDWGGYFHSRQGVVNFIPALPSAENVEAYAKVEPLNDDIYTVTLVWAEIIDGEYTAQTMSVNFVLQKESE